MPLLPLIFSIFSRQKYAYLDVLTPFFTYRELVKRMLPYAKAKAGDLLKLANMFFAEV